MKTNNILKIGFFAAAFALLSVGVKAQTPTASPTLPTTPSDPTSTYTSFTGAESQDTVTVGSRMPYKVDAQTAVTGLTFEYKWLFSPALTVQSLVGVTLTGTNDYYTANEISVVMPGTTGTVTVNTNVRSLAGGTVMCTGAADDTYTVEVVDRPTIKWAVNGVTNNCSTATAVSIPLTTLSGYKQFEIAYTIKHYANVDKTGATTTSSTKYIVLTGNTINLPATEFASGIGAYEVTVTNITDRISRKSLDQTLVASVAGDLPTDAYTVVIYPAPVTKPLQHVKNM